MFKLPHGIIVIKHLYATQEGQLSGNGVNSHVMRDCHITLRQTPRKHVI